MDMYDQYSDVVGKLDKIKPSSEAADEYLNQVAKRAGAFHPQEYVKPPNLDAEQAFSKDPATREAARKNWEEFLTRDEDEIRRLKNRRNMQEMFLNQHKAQSETLTKARKVLEKLAQSPTAAAVLQDEAGWAWYHVAVEGEPRMAGIVSDYQRIIREYDAIIARREAEHEANEAVLRTLRVIRLHSRSMV